MRFLGENSYGEQVKKRSGSFVNCVAIDRNDNNRQSILPHIHENRLELFYVCSGNGQYMVDNRYYPIGKGDIVICNQGVLHGEEPEQVRQIRSYSVALTGVQVEGLPPNCLIAAGEYPVVSCGQLAAQVGETMRLLYLLSADTDNLGAVCSSLAEAMLNLTDALLCSRVPAAVKTTVVVKSRLCWRIACGAFWIPIIGSRSLCVWWPSELRVSEYYLAHVFKQEFGVPPMQYVMKRRIGEAQGILMHTETPIAEIADTLGFSSICHFNAMFKKYTGTPPERFRQSFRQSMTHTEENKNP